MKRLLELAILTIVMFLIFTLNSPAFAFDIKSNKIHVADSNTSFDRNLILDFANIATQVDQELNMELYIVPDVKTNMFTDSRLIYERVSSIHDNPTVIVLVATDRKNRIGTYPAIRVVANIKYIPQVALDNYLNNTYYPILSNDGFNKAFTALVTDLSDFKVKNS